MVLRQLWQILILGIFLLLSRLAVAGDDIYFLDRDGDGYGVGDAFGRGEDADDRDPLINTTQTVLKKYGGLQTFLAEKGYSPERLLFIAPNSNNDTASINTVDSLFATWSRAKTLLQPGDAVIFRAGTYHQQIELKNILGTVHKPILFLAYPGERVVFDNCGAGSNAACFSLKGAQRIIIDGFIFDNETNGGDGNAIYLNGANRDGRNPVYDVTIRNVLARNLKSGFRGMVNVQKVLIENCVVHDTLSHGVYFGSSDNEQPNSDIHIQNSIFYRTAQKYDGRFCIQHNGRVDGLFIERNICHSNMTGGGISLVNGTRNASIKNNLIFNNAKQGIVLFGYASKSGAGGDFVNNEIINNTIWVGRYDQSGQEKPLHHAGILLNDSTDKMKMLYTNIRNNIVVTQAGSAVAFQQPEALDVSIMKNNIFYGPGSGAVIAVGDETFSLPEIERLNNLMAANRYVDPEFSHVSVDDYQQPEQFDFRLRPNSPAIDFCPRLPEFAVNDDLTGLSRSRERLNAGCFE
nr:right-handed parallel beta-helix repeat-containing protein [uncultured Desulfuromonas sp.]